MEQSKLPMIELHLHLDGAIPPETMWALAQEKGVPMPAETLEGFQHWLVETSDCADVNTYLARFELPLQLMQDAPSIARVTKDLMTELSRQGHIYDEIRFAPQLHRRKASRSGRQSRRFWRADGRRWRRIRAMTQGFCSARCVSDPRRSIWRKTWRRCDWQRNFWGAASWVRTLPARKALCRCKAFIRSSIWRASWAFRRRATQETRRAPTPCATRSRSA